jgi:hypothetical protein
MLGIYCAVALPLALGVLSIFIPGLVQKMVVSAAALAIISMFLLSP